MLHILVVVALWLLVFFFCIIIISAAYFNVLALVKSFCGVFGFAVGVIGGFIIYVSLGLVVLGVLAGFVVKYP
jgi:hypothetical protein